MNVYRFLIAGVLIALGLLIFESRSDCRTTHNAPSILKAESGFERHHIFREVHIVINNRNVDDFFKEFLHTPLKYFLPGNDKLAGVESTKALTKCEFPEVGSVRQVVLKNGETAREEVMELQTRYLKYKVTDYTTKQAEPLEYGIGEFWFIPQTENSFLVRWRYSFKLKETIFPGSFGCMGRRLFKWRFVDSDWADYMNISLNKIKAHAEGNTKTQ